MSSTLVVALLILVIVALAIAFRNAWRPASRDVEEDRPNVRAAPPPPPPLPDAVGAMPGVIAVADESPITWTAQLTTATLDEAARLRLIDGLVLLRSAWATALLRRASEEEREPHVRARIAEALAACGERVETSA